LDIAGTDAVNFVVKNQTNGFGLAASAAPLSRGVWHHLVAVYDAGVMLMYVDGLLSGTNSLPGTLQNAGPTPDHVLIGATRTGADTYSYNWKGFIDEVAFYDHALSGQQVLTHYLAGQPLPTLSISAQSNHVSLSWPLSASVYMLKSSTNVTGPFNSFAYTTITNLSAQTLGVTLPVTGRVTFFRLMSP
jgi:hypothetical protein